MKYKYSVESESPMRFYKFLCRALPVLFVLNILSILFTIPAFLGPEHSIQPPVILSLCLNLLRVIFLFVAFRALQRKEWSGVIFSLLYVFFLFAGTFVDGYFLSKGAAYLFVCFVACVVFLIPMYIYFRKRRLLFLPLPADYMKFYTSSATVSESSAPVSDPPNQSGSAAQKPRTFVECPACGLMVPKGQLICDCGHDLESPSKKRFKKFVRFAVPAVFCVCLVTGSFFAGRYSMQPEIEAARQSGYDSGHASGYSEGHQKGYSDAKAKFEKESSLKEIKAKVYIDAGETTYHNNRSCFSLLRIDSDIVSIEKNTAVLYGFSPCPFCQNYVSKPIIKLN